MKKARKILIYIILLLFIVFGFTLGYVKFGLPNVGDAPDLKVKVTTSKLERGRYLANNVTLCVDCHSHRQWNIFAGPPASGSLGSGGEVFNERIGFPGAVYSPNITPYNLKNWTDGELFRLITTGVTKHGKALMNIMPYTAYGKMDEEDIYAIIAYIRTLPSVSSTVPDRKLNFPVNFLVNTIPKKAHFQKLPSASDTLKYGGYLVNAAACVDCHTKQKKGNSVKGMEFAGGREFASPAGSLYSSNLTSDKTSGIGSWSKRQFIERFKMYAGGAAAKPLAPGQFQTVMPWIMYAGMKESDLGAMYTYLQTLKPIQNTVAKFIPKQK